MQFSGKRVIFIICGAGTTGYAHAKMNLDIYLTLFTKVDSKWITDVYVKLKTIKLLEDNKEAI